MKIVDSTPDRLVLRHAPWVLSAILWLCGAVILAALVKSAGTLAPWGWAAGGVGLAAAVAAALFFGQRVDAVFDRTKGTVELTRRLGPWRRRRTVALPSVDYVMTLSLDHERDIERLALKTEAGLVPITPDYSAFQNWDRVKLAVNDWLRKRETPGTERDQEAQSSGAG